MRMITHALLRTIKHARHALCFFLLHLSLYHTCAPQEHKLIKCTYARAHALHKHVHGYWQNFDSPTCSFKVSTKLQSFSDAALGVHWKSPLDVIHLDPSRCVWTLPEQTIYKNLPRYASETVLQHVIKNASPVDRYIQASIERFKTNRDRSHLRNCLEFWSVHWNCECTLCSAMANPSILVLWHSIENRSTHQKCVTRSLHVYAPAILQNDAWTTAEPCWTYNQTHSLS